MPETIFDRIKNLANMRNLTLSEVARLSGLRSRTTIYRYKTSRPRDSSLIAIANTLDTTLSYLKNGQINKLAFALDLHNYETNSLNINRLERIISCLATNAAKTITAASRFNNLANITTVFEGELRLSLPQNRQAPVLMIKSHQSGETLEFMLDRPDAVLCKFTTTRKAASLRRMVLRYYLNPKDISILHEFINELSDTPRRTIKIATFDLDELIKHEQAEYAKRVFPILHDLKQYN